MADREFTDWIQLLVVACLLGLVIARTLQLRARGVSVIARDRQRSASQMLSDAVLWIALICWFYLTLASAWSDPHFPSWLDARIFDATPARAIGAVLLVGGLAVYGLALRALGESWRIGIDREKPGAIVTWGIFARTRNPISVGFDLMFVGTFLVQGRIIFLVLAVILVVMIDRMIRREERFLEATYGGTYREYSAHVGRYVSKPWKPSDS